MKSRRCSTWMNNAVRLVVGVMLFSQQCTSQLLNIATGREITAEIGCGTSGNETFISTLNRYVPARDRDKFTEVCQQGDTRYTPDKMVDGDLTTFWQSTSRRNLLNGGLAAKDRPDIRIYLDLGQEFDVQRITFVMGESYAPGEVALYKSSTDFDNMRIMSYLVTKTSDCQALFGVDFSNAPTDINSVTCAPYSFTPTDVPSGAEMAFDFTGVSGNTANWRLFRYLRVEFYSMHLILGLMAIEYHHYSITDIAVQAECKCNGQQTACEKSSPTGTYECVCGGNTQGPACENCLPLFNQKRYTYGVPCEACNCHGHSQACYYDEAVSASNSSLNQDGVNEGGGVCVECQNNTAGFNCEKCIAFHYRPLNVLQTADDPCVPCECTGPGIKANPDTNLLGDCVMNSESSTNGLLPGYCFCKDHVTGPQCDTCKPQYYNLNADNPLGCEECACDINGTLNNDPECDTSFQGQCPCKQHVMNRRCDECFDNYYGLSGLNAKGCSECNCAIGGSLTTVCNKENGQCPCRSNIVSRACAQPADNYYYPGPHFIYQDFENLDSRFDRNLSGALGFGYVPLTGNSLLTRPFTIRQGSLFSGKFFLVVRYSYSSGSAPTPTTIRLTQALLADQNSTFSFPACSVGTWCYVLIKKSNDAPFDIATNLLYNIQITPEGAVNLDRIVALPVEFHDTTSLFNTTVANEFSVLCDVVNNDMKVGTDNEDFCLSSMFSLASNYLNGALACGCHPLGSFADEGCETYGGQCRCKPGVMGRKCDQCQIEYYQLTANGCSSCNCQTEFKLCETNTGQCLCPPNAAGRQCEDCEPNHWNWDITRGCEACNCDPTGSVLLQCNSTTGICSCRAGVMGSKCSSCKPGYKWFSTQGCSTCSCDQSGSTSLTCDAVSGQCPCKTYVGGLRCESCTPGSFFNSEEHKDGCLQCVCMGITSTCTSTSWRYNAMFVSLADTSYTVNTKQEIVLNNVTTSLLNGLPAKQVELGINSDVYWSFTTAFNGNNLGLYGGAVQFTVYYESEDTDGAQPITPTLMLICSNKYFYFNVSEVAISTITELSAEISIENMNMELTGENMTRADLLLCLTDVTTCLVPASYWSTSHTSTIANVMFNEAQLVGIGPQALSVEQCSCPTGYKGLSCEECITGYRRVEATGHRYLGRCEPCTCYGHSTTCDPESGACVDCQHNTDGFSCELCAPGFQGDATGGTPFDCSTCPCLEPRVENSTCSNVNGLPECSFCKEGYQGRLCDSCAPFYFGNPELQMTGKCEKCFCNNNSDACDVVTGQCIGCEFNTSGHNCERCADGWYGNATDQNCSQCLCNLQGSTGPVCDPYTGQCPCYEGVGGRTCDSCKADYYGYDDPPAGCLPCECNEFGSLDTQCDESGICTCDNTVDIFAIKCDNCTENYFGLPTQACKICSCNDTGTVDSSTPCDVTTGQCQCKVGVEGQNCDTCERLHFDFSADGCTGCDECAFSLGDDTVAVQEQWREYWNTSSEVRSVQLEDGKLQDISSRIDTFSEDLDVSEANLNFIDTTVDSLEARVPLYTSGVNGLSGRVETLVASAETLLNDSRVNRGRLLGLNQDSLFALATVEAVEVAAPSLINTMSANNESAIQLLQLGQGIYIGINSSFESEQREVAIETALIATTKARVEQMATNVEGISNLTEALKARAENEEVELVALSGQAATLASSVEETYNRTNEVDNDLEVTYTYKNQAETQLAEALSSQSNVSTMVLRSEQNCNSGSIAIQDAIYIHDGNVFGIQSAVDSTIAAGVDLTGITSWNQAKAALNASTQQSSAALGNFEIAVQNAEEHSASLKLQATDITLVYNTAKPRGENAVTAIENYESVITNLQTSLETANDAKAAMEEAQAVIAAVSIAGLQEQANSSKIQSQQVLSQVSALNGRGDELITSISNANSSLLSAKATWTAIDNATITLLTNAAAVVSLTQSDSSLDDNITVANRAADLAISTADNTIAMDSVLQRQVAEQEQTLTDMDARQKAAAALQAEITAGEQAFENQLNDDVQRNIDSIAANEAVINSSLSVLEAELDKLAAQVQEALDRLTLLEQPVRLNIGMNEQYDNPQAGDNMLHTQISLDFKFSLVSQGILFFSHNTDTAEKVLLQIVNGQLLFEIANVDTTIRMISPAILVDNIWYRVYASRYENDGQLSVVKLSTGGQAVSNVRGQSSNHKRLALNSPIYIGNIPSSLENSDKIYLEDASFNGCIYNIKFNYITIPIWQSALAHNSTSVCCAKPSDPPTPPTIAAVSFYGFGYLSVVPGPQRFSVVNSFQVSLQFRTFSPNAVVFLVDKTDVEAYIGIYMVNGSLRMNLKTSSGNSYTVSLSRTYNDGNWYQVTSVFSSTTAMIYADYVDKTINNQTEVQSLSAVLTFASLAGATITFGGQNPFALGAHGPVANSFAGCMQAFRHTVGASLSLRSFSMLDGLNSSASVDYDTCYEEVVKGPGIYKDGGYAMFDSARFPSVNRFDFDLYTYDPSGVLLFALLMGAPSRTFLYIGLFNGDVFLLFDQGLGIQPAVRTVGLFLSDGQKHQISVQFGTINRPSMRVDGVTYTGQVTMNVGMRLAQNRFYLGGIPGHVGYDDINIPAGSSHVGGIANLAVNLSPIDEFGSDLLEQNYVYLSGIAAPPATSPPPPYSTTIAPSTTPQPTCAIPYDYGNVSPGWSIGEAAESYIAFDITGYTDLFSLAFALRITFKAYQPNGLLVYMASEYNFPRHWFAVFMDEGYIAMTMVTHTNNADVRSETIKTKDKYDDGKEWELEILRINGFAAIIIMDTRDYVNNNGTSTIESFLNITTGFYLGGVPSAFGGMPFTDSIPKMSFSGCVLQLDANSRSSPLVFDALPRVEQNVEECLENVMSGLFFNDTNAYVRVGSNDKKFSIITPFTVIITIGGTVREGILLAGRGATSDEYFALAIQNGYIIVVINNNAGGPSAVTYEASGFNSFTLCDNTRHTITMTLTNTGVQIQIDDLGTEARAYTNGYEFQGMFNVPLYAGGVPQGISLLPLVNTPFQGCIHNISIGGEKYVLSRSTEKMGVTSGCPAPAPAPSD